VPARFSLLCVCPLLLVSCSDPVHDVQVVALGAEDPNVPAGPNHRPGQPCIWCHGEEGPAKTAFTVAGTVYSIQARPDPAAGAQVLVEDTQGRTQTITTNTAGNFYVTGALFQPNYPIRMSVKPAGGGPGPQMLSVSNREGSCAACHYNPPGPNSPGPVFITYAFVAMADAGM
jgi:hypothetical protein